MHAQRIVFSETHCLQGIHGVGHCYSAMAVQIRVVYGRRGWARAVITRYTPARTTNHGSHFRYGSWWICPRDDQLLMSETTTYEECQSQ